MHFDGLTWMGTEHSVDTIYNLQLDKKIKVIKSQYKALLPYFLEKQTTLLAEQQDLLRTLWM